MAWIQKLTRKDGSPSYKAWGPRTLFGDVSDAVPATLDRTVEPRWILPINRTSSPL